MYGDACTRCKGCLTCLRGRRRLPPLMLPTFVIGLREGVEAFLIVGIIAAFLRQEGRRDALRWIWAGVVVAIVICAAVGVTLELVSRSLPHAQQEGLETVVAGIAVGAVT